MTKSTSNFFDTKSPTWNLETFKVQTLQALQEQMVTSSSSCSTFAGKMVVYISNRLLRHKKLLFLCRKSRRNDGNFPNEQFRGVSNFAKHTINVTLQNTKVTLSTGKLAKFADGSVVVTQGETSVMATAVSKPSSSPTSMVPLSVYYRQKAAAAGRIPTNFFRRELSATESEILTSRVIDRSIRPLFDKDFNQDTQIICNLLAMDGTNEADVLAINAASAALAISNIPWNDAVGAVRICMIDEKFLVNPTRQEIRESRLNLIVSSGGPKSVIMLEGYGSEVPEHLLIKAISLGISECQEFVGAIKTLKEKYGKPKKELTTNSQNVEQVLEFVTEYCKSEIIQIFTDYNHDKMSRDNAIQNYRMQMQKTFVKLHPDLPVTMYQSTFTKVCTDIFRKLVLETNKRCDGRSPTQLRDIQCEVQVFKPLHGSALFQRGQTQVLCTVTLDSLESALKADTISMLTSGHVDKKFFLHYEFPPYATNEMGSVGGIGRRELGHGVLAEKGLRPIIPKDYPFTIRLTSEVLESNGSSSMASVCGGSMALMDAGVPTIAPAAGVAMGLITKDPSDKSIQDYKILTDILGIEDFMGDMDFKIAGTKKGITALQADVKLPSVPFKIILESLRQGRDAIAEIIDRMQKTISTPRTVHSGMPVTEVLEVPIHLRSKFIGVGGINLKKILVETGVQISQKSETQFSIFAPNQDAMDEAKVMFEENMKKDETPELEFGCIYTATVVELRDTGVMVKLYPTMLPVLLPNSQLDQRRIAHPSALNIEIGQQLQVKYFGRDPASGRMRLSRKVLQ